MAENRTLKEMSRSPWLSKLSEPTDTQLILGCLQRIADSHELISKNYLALLEKIQDLDKRCKYLEVENQELTHKLNSERSAKSRFQNKYNKLRIQKKLPKEEEI